jgi:signal peptidase II
VAEFGPRRPHRLVLCTATAAATATADLATKAWAWKTLRLQGPRGAIDGVLQFEFGFNTGSAFGMLRDASWGHAFFVSTAVVLLVWMSWLAWRLPVRSKTGFMGVGLVVGGTLGNLHDRLFRELLIVGEGIRPGVVDFIVVFYAPSRRWPAFNLADVALVLGASLVLATLARRCPSGDG